MNPEIAVRLLDADHGLAPARTVGDFEDGIAGPSELLAVCGKKQTAARRERRRYLRAEYLGVAFGFLAARRVAELVRRRIKGLRSSDRCQGRSGSSAT